MLTSKQEGSEKKANASSFVSSKAFKKDSIVIGFSKISFA